MSPASFSYRCSSCGVAHDDAGVRCACVACGGEALDIELDHAAVSRSRLAELNAQRGELDEIAAATAYHRYLLGMTIDHMEEPTYPTRKRIHNLKDYTWVEQQGNTYDEIQAQWYPPDYWTIVRRAVLLLLLVCAACDSEKAAPVAGEQATPTVSAAAPKALLALDARYKGDKLPLVSALAFSRGGSAVQLTLSTHELVCKHLREVVERMPGELSFDLTLAPLLIPDGTTNWAMTRARFGAVTRQGNLGAVDVNTFNPSEDISVALDHTLLFPPDKLVLKGQLLATGCGVIPWTKKAMVNPQAELTVAVAGKTVPINGATLSAAKDGRTTLRLTSEPHPCGSVVGSDIALTVTLEDERATAIRAEGYTLPRTLFKKLDAELSATVEGDDVTMSGQLEIGRYRLEIDGKVRAQRCP